MLEEYAEAAGKSLPTLSLPVADPPLSVADLPTVVSRVVPERLRSGVALIESLRHQTAANDGPARRDFGIEPLGVREAIQRALS